jgi:hypothetical protein
MPDIDDYIGQNTEGVEEDVPLVRRQRCAGCAFTPGTPAFNSPLTFIKSRLCVETGQYFYCHEDSAGHYTEEAEALCAGWLQGVTAKIEGREYDGLGEPELEKMREAIDFIADYEETAGVSDPTGRAG